MGDQGLVFSFEIDSGELAGYPAATVFCMGFEFHHIWAALGRMHQDPDIERITMTLREGNVARFLRAARQHGLAAKAEAAAPGWYFGEVTRKPCDCGRAPEEDGEGEEWKA